MPLPCAYHPTRTLSFLSGYVVKKSPQPASREGCAPVVDYSGELKHN
nr:MAG TPA: hypothetical protein [Caudoviricetes sp.]